MARCTRRGSPALTFYQDLETGRFSMIEFYRHRIKRITPALLIVVLAALRATQFLMLADEAKVTGE
jgi:peptidoglycan/LPS O-acetylase OafA/YrhL